MIKVENSPQDVCLCSLLKAYVNLAKISAVRLVSWLGRRKCLLYKPGDLNSIPGTHRRRRELIPKSYLLNCPQMPWHMHTHLYTHTYNNIHKKII